MINILFKIVNIYLITIGYIVNLIVFLFLIYYLKKKNDR